MPGVALKDEQERFFIDNFGREETYLGGLVTARVRSADIMAFITGYRERWSSGATVAEAVGGLVLAYPEYFRVVI